MTKLFWVLIFSLTFLSCVQNNPKVDKDKQQIDKVCDSIMQAFATENFSQPFDILKQNSVMSFATIDTLKVRTIDYFNNVFPAYGKVHSYEFILEHKIKNFITKRFYILRFDKYYLKFDFTLYNNGNKWKITSFAYNEDLIELLY